jgi:hypothetical protein
MFQFRPVGRLDPLKALLSVSAGIHAVEEQHMKVDKVN